MSLSSKRPPAIIATLALLLVTLLTVTACGFKLRGQKPLPPNLHAIYIDSTSPYSPITLQLTQVMKSMGIKVVDKPADAPITLYLYGERFRSSTLSRSASASTKEYTLTVQISYKLLDQQGKTIYGPKLLITTRGFVVSEDEVLSTSNEQAALKKDMQRDLMYQILGQLSSEDVAAAMNAAIDGTAVVNDTADDDN